MHCILFKYILYSLPPLNPSYHLYPLPLLYVSAYNLLNSVSFIHMLMAVELPEILEATYSGPHI